jgi:hypothetical protein
MTRPRFSLPYATCSSSQPILVIARVLQGNPTIGNYATGVKAMQRNLFNLTGAI